jgi:TolA-binding protein
MAKLEDLAERVDRLVLRHQELKRTSGLIEQQLAAVTAERDSLKSRLGAARARIDALLDRLPAEATSPDPAAASAVAVAAAGSVGKGGA